MTPSLDRQLLSVTRTVLIDEFEDAWVAKEKACGTLSGSLFKALLFGITGLAFLAVLVPDMIGGNMAEAAGAMLLCVVSVCGFAYETAILPRMVQTQARRVYQADARLCCEESIMLTVGGYRIKNRYETICGYWSQTACCAESKTLFVFCGGRERELIIIPKACIEPAQLPAFCEKMQEIFGSRYRCLPGAKK